MNITETLPESPRLRRVLTKDAPFRVNYLNAGQAAEGLLQRIPAETGHRQKRDLLDRWALGKGRDPREKDLIRQFGGSANRRIDLAAFTRELEANPFHRERFRELGCRGFSYVLHRDIRFIDHAGFCPDIDFRIALMPDATLYYPPRIRRYLRRVGFNHYKLDGFPSICFALGRSLGDACFILVLQSDLAYRKPAFVRDHFRGWRKVLMHTAITDARGRFRKLYLPFAEDVVRACTPLRRPTAPPTSWRAIYDRSAAEFGFEETTLAIPQNLQVYSDLEPVFTDRVYALDL